MRETTLQFSFVASSRPSRPFFFILCMYCTLEWSSKIVKKWMSEYSISLSQNSFRSMMNSCKWNLIVYLTWMCMIISKMKNFNSVVNTTFPIRNVWVRACHNKPQLNWNKIMPWKRVSSYNRTIWIKIERLFEIEGKHFCENQSNSTFLSLHLAASPREQWQQKLRAAASLYFLSFSFILNLASARPSSDFSSGRRLSFHICSRPIHGIKVQASNQKYCLLSRPSWEVLVNSPAAFDLRENWFMKPFSVCVSLKVKSFLRELSNFI